MPCIEEFFYKNGNKTDGLFTFCKECDKQKTVHWQENNREQLLIHNFKMNRKPHRMEARRINSKQRRENGYYDNYYKNNPEQFKKYNQDRQHKNHDISEEQWGNCKSYFNYECCYCGISEVEAKEKYGQYLHKEHYDDDGANDISNCVPSCKVCNSSKWKFDTDEWYPKQEFYSEQKLEKINKWISEDYKQYL